MTTPVVFDNRPDAQYVLTHMINLLVPSNVCIAGSLPAAVWYGKPQAWGDVDVFAYNSFELVRTTESLLHRGWELSTEKDHANWRRWMRFGVNPRFNNTIHLNNGEWDINITGKTFEGYPVRSLVQTLETFDFGLLALGYDMRRGTFTDQRLAWFPGENWYQLPMLEERHARWSDGLLVPYTGIRQAGRYHKYAHRYGYDLSLVKPALVQGYEIAAAYAASKDWSDKDQKLAVIYSRLAEAVSTDDWTELAEVDNSLPLHNDLDDLLRRLD